MVPYGAWVETGEVVDWMVVLLELPLEFPLEVDVFLVVIRVILLEVSVSETVVASKIVVAPSEVEVC